MKSILRLALAYLILAVSAGTADADIIFDIQGATFDDGTSLTGSFTTDDATTTLLAADLSTQADAALGLGLVATDYTLQASIDYSTLPEILSLTLAGDPASSLDLLFAFPGIASSGATPIILGAEFQAGGSRELTGGEVVVRSSAVPEPASLALLALSLPAVLAWRRRGRAIRPASR